MKRTYALGRSGFGSSCLIAQPVFCIHHFSVLPLLLVAVLMTAQAVSAQTGQNAVIHDTMNHTTNSPSFFDATQFSGADPCAQIQNAFAALPTTGGTVDARGLVSGTSTTITCSVNPIPSTAKGRLLLSSATYLAQVPWVIQSNDVNIVGTGASDNTGSNNTIIQACASGQANCGGNVFPSGSAVIQMGTISPANTVFRSSVKELAVDCQDVPGVSGFQVVAAQEETVFDLVRATGCRVASFDIGMGDSKTMNGAALSNFEANYTNGAGCPHVIAGSILTATRDSSGVVTATYGFNSSPALATRYEVVISGAGTADFNGTYRVNSVNAGMSQFKYTTNATGGSSTGGTFTLYPVGVRVWQNSTNHVRPIVNGTINGTDCKTTGHSQAPIAVELSGGSPLLQAIHAEGFDVGVQIGDLTGTTSATLIDVKLAPSTTGVVISNQFPSGALTPNFAPTGNIDILNLDVSGGNGTNAIIDNINNNTLTALNNQTVGYYLFGTNGVTTNAVPETGLTNAVDTNNKTLAVYSGSSNVATSVGASGGIGSLTSAHYLGVQATGPSCTFTSGGGIGFSCALDTGSTDSIGTIIATTGTGPSGTGTITLTFNSNLGSDRPSCMFMASDKGTGTWNALAVMKDNTPATGGGNDKFT